MHGFVDLIDGQVKKRRIGGFTALVGGDGVGAAQNNFLWGIRTVARRIGRAEESDSRRAESYGKMERARIAADDAAGILQKSHQLTEFSVVNEWLGIAAGCFHRRGEGVFPGAVVDDATNSQAIANFLAEEAKTVGGPAFRTPTSTGAEDDVTSDAILCQCSRTRVSSEAGTLRAKFATGLAAPARRESSPF